jgi:hypothetical protein
VDARCAPRDLASAICRMSALTSGETSF